MIPWDSARDFWKKNICTHRLSASWQWLKSVNEDHIKMSVPTSVTPRGTELCAEVEKPRERDIRGPRINLAPPLYNKLPWMMEGAGKHVMLVLSKVYVTSRTLVLILHNCIFNVFHMPRLHFDNKRKNINSYASDQFSAAITHIWFLFYKHVILLSFTFYLGEFSEWGWACVLCDFSTILH